MLKPLRTEESDAALLNLNRQVRVLFLTRQDAVLRFHLTSKTVLPNSITSNTNKRTFEVFNDADNADESVDMPRKKMRKDSTALQAVSPRILNTGISPVQDAFSNMQLQQKTAPSLKNRSAFTNPNLTHEFGTQRNQLLQSTRAMLLSSLNGDLMSPLPQPPSRSLPKARNDENRPVSTLLGSPFRPTVTKSRQSSHSSRLKRALLHRPSDGAIPRYPIFKRDQHRRPSDVYMRVHRDSSLSYMKQLSPRKKSELKRDDSFWANLQQNAFKTPPKRQESLDSLFITGSDATILPIPHEPIHLDTPINETDQLVADMSGFSLDPKPGKGKEISGIFSHTTSGKRKNKRDI
ncbi:hypothetical protein CPB86DRAFT_14846 [Serendipita vermifera]|nr:hypothetical protein CPB86DRAFT_14846 [Serendipita vermifera]